MYLNLPSGDEMKRRKNPEFMRVFGDSSGLLITAYKGNFLVIQWFMDHRMIKDGLYGGRNPYDKTLSCG